MELLSVNSEVQICGTFILLNVCQLFNKYDELEEGLDSFNSPDICRYMYPPHYLRVRR